jgi:hypothetical protein
MTIIDDTPVKDLTDEQLAFALASRRAIANAEPLPPLEWQRRERTPEERAFQFAQWGRSIGASEGAIGCELTRALRDHGWIAEDVTELVADVGVVWKLKTPEELLVDIASGMLETGWSEVEVTWAIDGLVSNGR